MDSNASLIQGTLVEKKMKILVIDDHAVLREGLKTMLHTWREDAEVIEAENAAVALNMVSTIGDLDLILLDLALPDVQGYELLQTIVAENSAIPIVILSVTDRPSVIEDVLRRGAKGYLPKSASQEVMVNALNLVFSGSVYVPPSLLDLTGEIQQREKTSDPVSLLVNGEQRILTDRQMEVIELLLEGKTNKEIALALNMSPATVRSHLTVIFRQLNVKNRTEAVHVARNTGLIGADIT